MLKQNFVMVVVLLGLLSVFAGDADNRGPYLKDGKLTGQLEVVVLQGGFAGFTGDYYTVAPDGSWSTGTMMNGKKDEPKAKGKLSAAELAVLTGELVKNDVIGLPSHGFPEVNPEVIEIRFAKTRVALQPGRDKSSAEEDKAIRARYNAVLKVVKKLCRTQK